MFRVKWRQGVKRFLIGNQCSHTLDTQEIKSWSEKMARCRHEKSIFRPTNKALETEFEKVLSYTTDPKIIDLDCEN